MARIRFIDDQLSVELQGLHQLWAFKRRIRVKYRYNATASPFDWRYTQADLNAYLARLAAHGLAA